MTLRIAAVAAVVFANLPQLAQCRANGVGRLPPLGWNTWCTWGSCDQTNRNLTKKLHDVCTEQMVKDVAQAMLDQGLHAKGWTHVNLDDCWEATTRDPTTGAMRADTQRFPSGSLKPLADWLHDRNFSFGMYTALGNETCSTGGRRVPGNPQARGVPGSYGHFAQDAATFASWGVDYVKLDSCIHKTDAENAAMREDLTPQFSRALDSTGRKMWLNFHCNGPYQPWCAQWGNSWRIADDHHDNWASTAQVIEVLATANQHNQTGAYRWADADFLMTGGAGCDVSDAAKRCPGQTDLEYRTEVTLWALGGSAMLVATDVRNMTAAMRATLLNEDVLAIHQDALARPGGRIGYCNCGGEGRGGTSTKLHAGPRDHPTQCQIWARLLDGGDVALGLYNADEQAHGMTVNIADVFRLAGASDGLAPQVGATVRDVWEGQELGHFADMFAVQSVAAHEAQLFRLAKL